MGKKILVVDDEPEAVELVEFNLKQSGVSQDFLEHRRSRFPVVVVLPIDNQGADGWRSKRL